MSNDTPRSNEQDDLTPVEDQPVEETPAVAGGHDDGQSAQGEGAEDSY